MCHVEGTGSAGRGFNGRGFNGRGFHGRGTHGRKNEVQGGHPFQIKAIKTRAEALEMWLASNAQL